MVACVALVACNGGSSSSSGNASLRLANATLTHPSLDLLVNGSSALSATTTDTVSAYTTPPSGGPTLQIDASGSTTALTSTAPTLAAGNHYTLLAFESGGVLKTALLTEDFATPTIGSANLRIFVSAADAGKLDVYVTSPSTDLSTLTAPTATSPANTDAFATSLLTFSPGTYRLRVTAAGNTGDLRLDIPVVALGDQQVTTVVLTPAVGGVLLNGSTLVQQGAYAGTRNTNSRVRLAAAVAGAATISASASSGTNNVVIDPGSVAPAFGYYTLVPAGSALNVNVNGQSIGAPAAALLPGADQTLLVYGSANAATASLITDDNRTPSDASTVKLRLIGGITGTSGALALTANTALVASGVLPNHASGYVSVPGSASAMNLSLTLSTSPGTYYTSSTNVLNYKSSYSVLAGGDVGTPQLLIR